MTQKIRLKDTEIELAIEDEVYPFIEAGVFYIRMVLLSADGTPMKFMSVMPQDILYRTQPYTDEMMQDIKTAADKANEQATDAFMAKVAEEKENATMEVDDDNSMYHG